MKGRLMWLALLLCSSSNFTDARSRPNSNLRRWDQRWEIMDFKPKDSRPHGISYEATRAFCASSLNLVQTDISLDDYSKSGHHRLRLKSTVDRSSDMCLQHILNAGIHEHSSWEVQLYDDWNWMESQTNLTLVMQFLHALPSITDIHWELAQAIPPGVLEVIERKHPKCRLHHGSILSLDYYTWPGVDLAPKLVKIGMGEKPKPRDAEAENRDHQLVKAGQQAARGSLIGSRILHSIRAEIEYECDVGPKFMDYVGRVMTSCPTIRHLELSVAWKHCILRSSSNPFAFDFESSNTSFPPLESLTLSGYRFQDRPNGQKWVQQKPQRPPKKIPRQPRNRMSQVIMDHSGYEQDEDYGGIRGFCLQREPPAVKPQGRTNLEIWLEMMDWSRLHTLHLSNPQVYELEKLAGRILPSLKNVEFEAGDLAAIASFLGNTSTSLESIRLESLDGGWTEGRNSGDTLSFHKIWDEILAKHSRKLRDLKIIQARCYDDERYPEMYCSGHNGGSLFLNSSTHLIGLQRFSHLESLELDYKVGTEWDYAFLDAIAEITTLRRVTLRLVKSSGPHTRYLDILAPGIERYLRQIKKGVAFEKVEIDCYSYYGD